MILRKSVKIQNLEKISSMITWLPIYPIPAPSEDFVITVSGKALWREFLSPFVCTMTEYCMREPRRSYSAEWLSLYLPLPSRITPFWVSTLFFAVLLSCEEKSTYWLFCRLFAFQSRGKSWLPRTPTLRSGTHQLSQLLEGSASPLPA